MSDIIELKEKIDKFSKDRDWSKFNTPENLAKSISIEANELLECFQWSNDYNIDNVKEELADVFNYCFLLASVLNLDVKEIILDKIEKNEKKFSIEKCSGIATKYNKL